MFDEAALIKELTFKAVRSSGSGGQHVNKVSSKVDLYFNLELSTVFNEDEKSKLRDFFQNRLTKENILVLQCSDSRSQHRNKNLVIRRFLDLIRLAFEEEKERIPTKTPKSVIRKRLKNKRYQSEKKTNRKKPDID
ncbi:MAG: alternative ribosome rescue aminoacyl-tRNA hydrolase ArfB [Jejuia sp.]